MGPKPRKATSEHDLFRMELANLIDQRHELVKLAELIDWPAFEAEWGLKFESTTGRPALPTRLMASLLYLKHAFALSDEEVVLRWVENPYWQHFSGEQYFSATNCRATHRAWCAGASASGKKAANGCSRRASRPRRPRASSRAKAWAP